MFTMKQFYALIVPKLLLIFTLFDAAKSQNNPPSFSGCSGFNPTYITGSCASSFITLQEEPPIDTVLFTLSATDPEGDSVEFSILGDATLLYWFKLVTNKVARTANVVVNSRIDRESVTNSLTSLSVRMNDGNGNIIDVNPVSSIFITDINDNSPEFKNLPYRWEVPENTLWTAKTSFNVTMTDVDVTQGIYKFFYVANYGSSDGASNLFNETLRTSGPQASPLTGFRFLSVVSLMQPLDYESTRFYQVSVYAIEMSANGRNATTDIVLNVLDQQDTPPIFDGTPYITSVTENTPIGTLVYTVSAKDGDRGIPNPVEYFFDTSSSSTAAQLAALFSLNRTNGRVQVAANIDRESSLIASVYASFSLTIVASEVSAVSQPANISQTVTTLTITILDLNDNAPTFGQSSYNGTVVENTAVGIPITLLTTCTVTDLDDRDNSVFNLTVSNNTVFDVSPLSAIGSATVISRVLNSVALDYETVKSFSFEVVARETKTATKLSSTTTFTVFLIDANDNAPIFNQSKYTYSIPENSPNGTFVGQAWATDLDSGLYATITYSLGGTAASKFRIDPNTGQVQVAVNADTDFTLLDRETSPVLFLTVQGTDGGGLTGSTQMEVQLLDRNDQTPTFQRSVYEGSVFENSLSLDSPLVLVAIDLDLSPNNIISYSLVSSNSSSYFAIDNATGAVSVVRTIDYEALSNKTLYLLAIATDHGSVPLNSTAEIRIIVNDQNDQTPRCSQKIYNVTALETATYGTTIATLSGSDADSPGSPNSQIFFRLLAGAGDRFTLDTEGVRVIVERGASLDLLTYGKFHNLTVGIFDRGVPQLSNSCLVYVNILDVNNQAPYFSPVTTSATISEGIALYTPILTPPKIAIDPDSTANLTYSLLSSQISGRSDVGASVASSAAFNFSSLFDIDPKNGTLFAVTALDREQAQELTIPVFVRDLNAETPTPIQTATGSIVLTLTDINNKFPRFLLTGPSNNFTVQVSEISVPTVAINLRLQAADPDISTTSLTFNITAANRFFSIDSNTGQVYLISKLNYEAQTSHMFFASVSDGLHVTTSTVTVEVINANTFDPEFDIFPTPLSFPESIAVGTVITTVHAYDNDSGIFGVVQYVLISGETYFSIQSVTGQISLKKGLDRDVSGGDQQTLVVQAIDNPSGVDRRQISRQMVVNVLDVNDNPPTFPSGNFTYTRIKESYPTDYEIDSVRATDKDIGLNSAISYELQAMPGQSNVGLRLFKVATVNASDGYYAKLTINDTLLGLVGWYNLTLIARDGGTPQLTGTTALTFYIAPSDNGVVQDDSSLGRFRSALISTTLILIGGVTLSVLMMLRTYIKSRSIMKMYNNERANEASSTSRLCNRDNAVGPAPMPPPPPPQQPLPEASAQIQSQPVYPLAPQPVQPVQPIPEKQVPPLLPPLSKPYK